MPSAAAPDPPPDHAAQGAAPATSGANLVPPEQLLTEDNARAYRRFLDWSVGAGFKLGVVEVTAPGRRDALVAWTAATVPGTRIVKLDLASQEPLRSLLEETAAPGGMRLLVLTRLEEASDRRIVCAQLNVQRDDLARLFAVPWVMIVHPSAALDLQQYAPDFSDFAGLWLNAGGAEVAEAAFQPARRGQAIDVVAAPYAGGEAPGSDLLARSDAALQAGRLDEARDLLAQYDLAHPEAAGSVGRAVVEARFLMHAGDLAGARVKLEGILASCERDKNGRGASLALHDLGGVLIALGKYGEAENVFRRSLGLTGTTDGPTAGILLHNLAIILEKQGKYGEAEGLLRQALAIEEKALGIDHPEYAASLRTFATILEKQGKYGEAEDLLRRSLDVQEKALGIDHPTYAASLHALAGVLEDQARYEEAESLLRRALAVQGKALGIGHPNYGASLHALAGVLERLGKYEEAEHLLRQSLALQERGLGIDHPDHGASLYALASTLLQQGKYGEAEHLLRQSLAIHEKALGVDHPSFATSLHALAGVLQRQGRYEEAEGLLRRSLIIYEKALGVDHPHLYPTLTNLGVILGEQDRAAEAKLLIERAVRIAEQVHGNHHPDTGQVLGILAQLQFKLGKPEARDTAQRALTILLATLGPDHPVTSEAAPVLRHIVSSAIVSSAM